MIISYVDGAEVVVSHDGIELASYVHRPDPEQFEAPKPYLHPLRTVAGDVVTNYRPHDHRWHKGLQLTCTELSGHNLWGGHTYVDGEGYVALDNVGCMAPIGEIVAETDASGGVLLEHELRWRSAHGDGLVAEHRSLRFAEVDVARRAWSLEWRSELENITTATLSFGSPATRGLTGSGYSGLWWRGPRSFTGGRVITATDGETSAADARGTDAAWLAFVGDHDGVNRSSTLVFEPITDDGRFETRWFVRSEEFAAVNPSWAFDRTFELEPGASVRVGYRVTVVDGAWGRAEIEEWRRGGAR
ncbi:PmoA family protein [Agromyces sp. NPDC056965]|uniref:DUF6807 domain-containing protein n=1 Tax=Agromyces sp. NPDC056965 TaxID=3345983 RepID=UPI00362B2CC9